MFEHNGTDTWSDEYDGTASCSKVEYFPDSHTFEWTSNRARSYGLGDPVGGGNYLQHSWSGVAFLVRGVALRGVRLRSSALTGVE